MPGNHPSVTSEYLQSTRAVFQAGKHLRNALGQDRAALEFAITGLERAASRHDGGSAGYRAFMFSELKAAPASADAVKQRITEDALASLLTDMQVANVLMAAGQTLGETGKRAEASLLDEALMRLENTAPSIERSLPSALTKRADPGRFGFAEHETGRHVVQSTTLGSAIETFKHDFDETLAVILKEANGALTGVFKALSKLDTEKVLAALSTLGEQIPAVPEIGRLFRSGVDKLRGAISSITKWVGSEALTQIKEQVEKIWHEVTEGKLINQTLAWAFAIESTKSQIAQMLQMNGLQRQALDEGSSRLAELAVKFKENMALVRRVTSTLTLATTILAFTPLSGPHLMLLVASGYIVIAGSVALIGMDYADSESLLQRVSGVREIATGVVARSLGGSQ